MEMTSAIQASGASSYSVPDASQQHGITGSGQSESQAGAAKIGTPDTGQVTKAVDQLNQKLTSSSTQVVFDVDNQAHRIWLNVVDKQSGRVVLEIPPENIRKIVDSMEVQGLNIDKTR